MSSSSSPECGGAAAGGDLAVAGGGCFVEGAAPAGDGAVGVAELVVGVAQEQGPDVVCGMVVEPGVEQIDYVLVCANGGEGASVAVGDGRLVGGQFLPGLVVGNGFGEVAGALEGLDALTNLPLVEGRCGGAEQDAGQRSLDHWASPPSETWISR